MSTQKNATVYSILLLEKWRILLPAFYLPFPFPPPPTFWVVWKFEIVTESCCLNKTILQFQS